MAGYFSQPLEYYTEPERVRAAFPVMSPERAALLSTIAQRYAEENPNLENVPVTLVKGQVPAISYWNLQNPELKGIMLGSAQSPNVLAHELGHIQNIENAPYYRKFVDVARGLANIANSAGIPAAIALRLLMKDKQRRDEILNLLSGVTAAVNAPVITDELSATLNAIQKSPNKLQAAKELTPGLLSYMLASAVPITGYQLARMI